jgi:hypothetical protein
MRFAVSAAVALSISAHTTAAPPREAARIADATSRTRDHGDATMRLNA